MCVMLNLIFLVLFFYLVMLIYNCSCGDALWCSNMVIAYEDYIIIMSLE